jgi:inositol oxygenase
MYQVTKDYLPEEALYMIRYHSFYPGHRENAYDHLLNDKDRKLFEWVRKFNPYDLYSKSAERPSIEAVRPYYEDLISVYFPDRISW